jgi:hypothetical protein
MKMNSPKGMFSKKDNTMKSAKKVPCGISGSSNPDAVKANKLLQQAQSKVDSLRGAAGKM